MAGKTHTYAAAIRWTGNTGKGTASYTGYSRDHVISVPGKADLPGSSDPAFRGDATRYNPEDMLVASASTCHMLWYLHMAMAAGVVVTAYEDAPVGTMVEDAERGGYFTGIVLRPRVTIAAGSDPAKAVSAHEAAHKKCFIANSLNFPITIEPATVVGT
jgi:organic hydroperoxide reductase OsmC/OhrA